MLKCHKPNAIVYAVNIARYGGQAVIEGVMMRGKSHYCTSVRDTNGDIQHKLSSIKTSNSIANINKVPVLRGIAALGRSMVIGMKVMKDSMDMSGMLEAEDSAEPSKFEAWLEKRFGEKLTGFFLVISIMMSLVFSIGLFMLLPTWISSFAAGLLQGNLWALGIVEGLMRLVILILYLLIISKTKDAKRLFGYHGAEHKAINCYEAGLSLTIENVKSQTRLHRRCGTSFLLFVMIISMIFFLFIQTDDLWLRLGSRVLFVPFIAGVSFEVIRLAGISNSPIVRAISYPGMMLQKITTAEPENEQIAVAIDALEKVILKEENR